MTRHWPQGIPYDSNSMHDFKLNFFIRFKIDEFICGSRVMAYRKVVPKWYSYTEPMVW